MYCRELTEEVAKAGFCIAKKMHPIDTKQRPQLYKMNFLKLMSIFFFRPYVSSIQNRVLGNFATRNVFWIRDIRTFWAQKLFRLFDKNYIKPLFAQLF